MALERDKPLRFAVTAIPVPTLALAKVPAIALPERLAASLPSKPEAMTAEPVKAAAVVVS